MCCRTIELGTKRLSNRRLNNFLTTTSTTLPHIQSDPIAPSHLERNGSFACTRMQHTHQQGRYTSRAPAGQHGCALCARIIERFFFKVAAPHPVFIGDHFRGLVRDRGSSPRRPGATLRPWPLGHPAPAAIIERFDHASLAT
jgi:hypothetical protein